MSDHEFEPCEVPDYCQCTVWDADGKRTCGLPKEEHSPLVRHVNNCQTCFVLDDGTNVLCVDGLAVARENLK